MHADRFKQSSSLFTAESEEVVEEFVERVAGAKIIEKGLHRDSRARKDRDASQDVLRPGNEILKAASGSIYAMYHGYYPPTLLG